VSLYYNEFFDFPYKLKDWQFTNTCISIRDSSVPGGALQSRTAPLSHPSFLGQLLSTGRSHYFDQPSRDLAIHNRGWCITAMAGEGRCIALPLTIWEDVMRSVGRLGARQASA